MVVLHRSCNKGCFEESIIFALPKRHDWKVYPLRLFKPLGFYSGSDFHPVNLSGFFMYLLLPYFPIKTKDFLP
jgi:hypothetical protein